MKTPKTLALVGALGLALATSGTQARAAALFSEDFSNVGLLPGPNLEPSSGPAAIFNGSDVTFPGPNSRSYLRTIDDDYNTVDFSALATVTIPGGQAGWGLVFFGLGTGEPNPAYYTEPTVGSHIYMRPAPDDFAGGGVTIVDNAAETTFGGDLAGTGTHRLRMDWNSSAQQMTFLIDKDYTGGPFVADRTFGPFNGSDNGFDATNSRVFFGGANGAVFDDFEVTAPLPPPPPPPPPPGISDAYSKLIYSDNPYAYWRFDETDVTAPAADSSGHGVDGSYNQFVPGDGVPTLGVPGIPGAPGDTAVEFNGGSPTSQVYVADPINPTEYTLEAWVKADAGATTSRGIIVRTAADPRSTWSHQLRINADGQFEHYLYDGAERWVPYPSAPDLTIAQPDEWYHVVGTAVQGGAMELYVNGVREGYWPGPSGTIWAGGNQWRIGAVTGHGMDWFDGVIDEVAIYHQVLTPAQINEHYRAGVGITDIDIQPFAGPADLDLEGTFAYAVNAGSTAVAAGTVPVGGLRFGTSEVPGVTLTAQNTADPWGTRPEFGDTLVDNALETVMHGIRWAGAPNTVDVDLDVVPGNTYKLQLLFAENYWSAAGSRTFDINVEGQRRLGEFDALATAGGQSKGAVYTQTLTAADNKLNISLTPGQTVADKNPILNAFTLEFLGGAEVPELARRDNARNYLRLSEAPGATTAVNSSFQVDAQDGTYLGGPTLGEPGIVANRAFGNTAARFDGVDDYVQLPDTVSPVSYAIEAWVKPDADGTSNRGILVRTAGDPTTTWSHQLRITPAGQFQHYTYDGAERSVTAATPVEGDQWQHVVGVYTPGSPGIMDLYVNGVLEGHWEGSLNNPWTGGNQWQIGTNSGHGYDFFKGALDEVQTYAGALPPWVVLEHYRVGAGLASDPKVVNLDLADVVGGGNGFGTGGEQAIHPATGALTTGSAGQITDPAVGAARYHPVPDLPFVDGVFIPGNNDASGGQMTVASDGTTVPYPNRSGNSWDYFQNDPQSTAILNGVDYSAAGHSILSMHANKGITFDLDAIRAANPEMEVGRFQAVVGNGDWPGVPGPMNIDYNVYVDGVFKKGALITNRGVGFWLDIPLSASDRFLTLVGSDGGNDYSWDQAMFGDPHLELGRNVALGKPVTASGYYTGAGGFPAENVTDGELNDFYGSDRSFWLGRDGQLETLTIDLLGNYLIDRIDLQNGHNGDYNDRGIADFRISVSEDNLNWTEIIDRTLPSAAGTGNVIPISSYLFDPTSARYVRLDVDSLYGASAALNEIRVFQSNVVPEPSTWALAVLGMIGVAWAARRRRRAA